MADKTNTIFRALDRKASAITEFTMRQYRTKISTWVVLITGLVVISLLMLFYVDAMQRDFEAIDNDGDSVIRTATYIPMAKSVCTVQMRFLLFLIPGCLIHLYLR